MPCFIFIEQNLHAIGTTEAAAVRNAARASAANDYAPPFNASHHSVTVADATRGAYEAVRDAHGSLAEVEFDRANRRWRKISRPA
jgi:hypothetical protein